MELYHLRTFLAVADEGHLTRAAKRLHTSQPAVSAHIKTLEEELGVLLFIRTPKGMKPTAEGLALMDHARHVLGSVDALTGEAARLRHNVAGTVRIGLNTDPDFLRIGPLGRHLAREYPQLSPVFLSSMSEDAAAALNSGHLDAAFVYGGEVKDVESKLLSRFQLRVVGPKAWQEKLNAATLADLADMPWIWFTEGCPFTQAGRNMFKAQGLKPKITHMADQESMLRALVSSANGLTMLREDEALKGQTEGMFAVWPEQGPEMFVSLAFLRRRATEPLLKAVIHTVEAVFADPGELDQGPCQALSRKVRQPESQES